MTTELRLTNIIQIKGKIELLSGLHIGSGDAGLHIGGTDQPVIKNPHTDMPYIPGSSLKGKLRSLLEWYIGVVGQCQGAPLSLKVLNSLSGQQAENGKILLKLFGVSGDNDIADELKHEGFGITRLSVADSNFDENYAAMLTEQNLPATEVKFENSIDRISGTAASPRNFERVPAGALFDLNITMKTLSCDNPEELEKQLLTGLKLLELDALGGSGSRGYGKVKFHLDSELQGKLDALEPFANNA